MLPKKPHDFFCELETAKQNSTADRSITPTHIPPPSAAATNGGAKPACSSQQLPVNIVVSSPLFPKMINPVVSPAAG
jgi:hypothetical protein